MHPNTRDFPPSVYTVRNPSALIRVNKHRVFKADESHSMRHHDINMYELA